MSPLTMGSTKVEAISGAELTARSSALAAALDSGGPQLEVRQVMEAERIIAKVGERTSLAGDHTVVALAGATGSGKSSLFNAIVDDSVATVGARRPTTSRPVAAVWGSEDASELLDWLSVAQRHQVPAEQALSGIGTLDGLVLLDLPDFDSRVLAHRAEAERVLALADVFVWVTDPQKYADARLHDDYLRALATHDTVTVVVLNQSDRLSESEARQIRADLARLAAEDGIAGVQVIGTSATTGAGVGDLRLRLANAVAGRNAARHRLAADIMASAQRLRGGLGPGEPPLRDRVDLDLADALGRAAGIPTVVAAVERDYRNQALGRTGWPFTRWVRALRPDPLKRLRLDAKDGVEEKLAVTASDVRTVLGRSSLPPPTPAARSAVALATRRVGEVASEGLPPRWAEAVADAATPPGPDLADALDQAVVGTSLKLSPPLWWRVFGMLQLVLAAIAVLGLVWLVVLMVLGWLQLPKVTTPRLGPLPYPFLMLVGGLLLGVGLAALARVLARRGAQRRGERIRRTLMDAVDRVARERIIGPVRGVLERHRTTREALARASSSGLQPAGARSRSRSSD